MSSTPDAKFGMGFTRRFWIGSKRTAASILQGVCKRGFARSRDKSVRKTCDEFSVGCTNSPSSLITLKNITKIYRTQESVFLSRLGDLFEKTQSTWYLKEMLGPKNLEWLYREFKESIREKSKRQAYQKVLAKKAKELKDLVFKVDEFAVTALVNVSLEIQKGEFLAIAGPSGSGKTTLLNIIASIEEPSDGDVFFQNQALTKMTEHERSLWRLNYLGFIFQAYNLIPVLSAEENVEYALILKKIPAQKRMERVREALRFVGLSDCAHRRPNKLSGGQQQRLAIARAIAQEPNLILADEPTANIDSKTANSLLDLMETINKEKGTTFIFSSHDPLVLSRAKRLIRLRDGEVVQEEPSLKF